MNTIATQQTFESILTTCRNLFMDDSTFEQWKEYKDFLINDEIEVKAILSKATIQQLNKFVLKDKKSTMVDRLYSSLLSTVNLSDSFMYSPMDETYKEAFNRITSKYTESDFLAYKEAKRKAHEARVKALTNPETLDEFRQFISYKGEKSLTIEQRIRYDELTADTRKAVKVIEEKRSAEVAKVESVNAEMILKETTHTKKNIPLFVVVLSSRVEREVYNELNNRAKKLGGYYSSYNKGGAIAGFTFEKKEAAQLFMQVKESSVNAAELKQEEKEEKQQTASEALKEKGLKAIEEGEEELNKDRKDNTHRRAAMAANAEKQATAKVEFGKTLVKIAEKMEMGEIKYLDKIRAATDLETLNMIISQARYKHIKDKNLRSSDYVTSNETVFYASIPYPIVYNTNKSDLLRMQDISNGKKLAAGRMLKRFGNSDFVECNTTQRIEDYQTLFCNRCVVWNEWQVKNKKDSLLIYKRIERMGLNQINTLRAALCELIQLKNGTQNKEIEKQLKIKELERKYIGTKISGFFPTPETLTKKKIELLDLNENDKICEPSAGLGHMADIVKEMGFDVTCIEIHTGLAEVLKAKGHNVINGDFLSHSGNYDKIIMNPPFENLQDVAHVKHAYKLLNDGGKLVATMANNKQRTPEFLQFVEQNGWFEVNPQNSFSNAFNSTGVSTITVFLSK